MAESLDGRLGMLFNKWSSEFSLELFRKKEIPVPWLTYATDHLWRRAGGDDVRQLVSTQIGLSLSLLRTTSIPVMIYDRGKLGHEVQIDPVVVFRAVQDDVIFLQPRSDDRFDIWLADTIQFSSGDIGRDVADAFITSLEKWQSRYAFSTMPISEE